MQLEMACPGTGHGRQMQFEMACPGTGHGRQMQFEMACLGTGHGSQMQLEMACLGTGHGKVALKIHKGNIEVTQPQKNIVSIYLEKCIFTRTHLFDH
jgi:hypothetical protein